MVTRLVPICITLAVSFCGPGLVAAQQSPIATGTWQIAGTASAARFRDIGNDRSSFRTEFTPRVGYFVVKGLALEANIRLRYVSTEGGKQYMWGLGPGASYYFGGVSDRFYPFVSVRTLFTWDHLRLSAEGLGADRDFASAAWLGSVGGVWMIASRVGLSGELFYTWSRVTVGGTGGEGNAAERFGVQFGIAVFLF